MGTDKPKLKGWQEAADRLGVSVGWLKSQTKHGQGPTVLAAVTQDDPVPRSRLGCVEGIVEGGAAMNDQELYASFMADEAIGSIIRHILEPRSLASSHYAFFGVYMDEADAATK